MYASLNSVNAPKLLCLNASGLNGYNCAGRPIEWIYFFQCQWRHYSNFFELLNYGTAINATVHAWKSLQMPKEIFLAISLSAVVVLLQPMFIVGMVLNMSPSIKRERYHHKLLQTKGWRYRSATVRRVVSHLHSHGVMTFSSFGVYLWRPQRSASCQLHSFGKPFAGSRCFKNI